MGLVDVSSGVCVVGDGCVWMRVEEGMADRACFVVAQTLVNKLYAASLGRYSE